MKVLKKNEGMLAANVLIIVLGIIVISLVIAMSAYIKYIGIVKLKVSKAEKDFNDYREELMVPPEEEPRNIYIQSVDELNRLFGTNFRGKLNDMEITRDAITSNLISEINKAQVGKITKTSDLTGEKYTLIVGEEAKKYKRKYVVEFLNRDKFYNLMREFRDRGITELDGVLVNKLED